MKHFHCADVVYKDCVWKHYYAVGQKWGQDYFQMIEIHLKTSISDFRVTQRLTNVKYAHCLTDVKLGTEAKRAGMHRSWSGVKSHR